MQVCSWNGVCGLTSWEMIKMARLSHANPHHFVISRSLLSMFLPKTRPQNAWECSSRQERPECSLLLDIFGNKSYSHTVELFSCFTSLSVWSFSLRIFMGSGSSGEPAAMLKHAELVLLHCLRQHCDFHSHYWTGLNSPQLI